MYNPELIKSELIGLMGWQQNDDPNGWQLTDVNTSESGVYYNNVHPMLTIDNLISISKRYDDFEPSQGAVNGLFSAWLKSKTEEGILEAVDMWLESKFQKRSVKNLLEDDVLFDAASNLDDFDYNGGFFVGMEFTVSRGKGMRMKKRELGLQLEENQTVRIYLFKSGQREAVKFIDVDYNQGGGVQWFTLLDWELIGEGAYWVGYDQSAITGRSVNGVKDYGFGKGGIVQFPTGRHFEAKAIEVDGFTGELWDLSQMNYTVSTNYGLNFRLDVRCDYTSFIIDQKEIFRRLIFLNVGIKLLEEMVWNANSRVNRNESNMTRADLMYAIEGDTQKTRTGRDISLTGKREAALMAIAFDEAGLNRVCLPCRKKGVKIGAVGPVSHYR